VIAVLGLTILGAVGVFAYRAVFGGAVFPALPALIEAENGPNKNVPNYGDARPSNSSQTSIASAGSSEKFVSRWPADIQEPPKKTAPISRNPSAPPPSAPSDLERPPRLRPCRPLLPPLLPLRRQHLSRRRHQYRHRLLRSRRNHTVIIRSDGSGQTDIGRSCPPKQDKHHGTRGKAKCRSGASGRKSASAARS
jgi:hypothetical protein